MRALDCGPNATLLGELVEALLGHAQDLGDLGRVDEIGQLRPGQVFVEDVLADSLSANNRCRGQSSEARSDESASTSPQNCVGCVVGRDEDPRRPGPKPRQALCGTAKAGCRR
jgi:hypothetical protein